MSINKTTVAVALGAAIVGAFAENKLNVISKVQNFFGGSNQDQAPAQQSAVAAQVAAVVNGGGNSNQSK